MFEGDILAIDAEIQEELKKETELEVEYYKRISEINIILLNAKLAQEIKQKLFLERDALEKKILFIQTNDNLNFYIAETAPIIDSYKNILKTPLKLSFMGKKKDDPTKDKIIETYVKIAKGYMPQLNISTCKLAQNKITCENCGSSNLLEHDTLITICIDCGNQKEALLNSISYKDADRVNISQKYTYDRRIHFRDCINQYQGKQNSNIDPKIYEDLEQEYKQYGLLNLEPGISKEKKFERVKKEHIILFLQELGYDKHYDNVNLIYSTQTGSKCDDISHLDSTLMNDFDMLTSLYDKRFKHDKKIDRKNFINTQYVLFQLLNHHKHPCRAEDFSILKTIDRQTFHDDICKVLFEELGWNHTPYF